MYRAVQGAGAAAAAAGAAPAGAVPWLGACAGTRGETPALAASSSTCTSRIA